MGVGHLMMNGDISRMNTRWRGAESGMRTERLPAGSVGYAWVRRGEREERSGVGTMTVEGLSLRGFSLVY